MTVEESFARDDMTEQDGLQGPRSIDQVTPQVVVNFRLGLVLRHDRRRSFHHSGAGHSPDGLAQRERAPLADFPFDIGVRPGGKLGAFVLHVRRSRESPDGTAQFAFSSWTESVAS